MFQKMNKKQLYIVWLAGAALTLACVFPPWIYTFQARGISQVQKPAGYDFLLTPPAPERSTPLFGVSVDIPRLGVELLVIAVIGGAGFLTVSRKVD